MHWKYVAMLKNAMQMHWCTPSQMLIILLADPAANGMEICCHVGKCNEDALAYLAVNTMKMEIYWLTPPQIR